MICFFNAIRPEERLKMCFSFPSQSVVLVCTFCSTCAKSTAVSQKTLTHDVLSLKYLSIPKVHDYDL